MAEIETYQCRHGVMAHFAADQAVGLSLREYGEWGEDEIAVLAPYIGAGATVLDVGANVGTHTLVFARLVGPSGRVLAIEGNPETFTLLAYNVVENGHSGCVRPLNVLVGQAAGLVPFNLSTGPSENPGAKTFLPELTNAAAPVPADALPLQLPLITIDSLDLQRCAVMKIDVEGMESQVLRGAVATIERCQPIIYFEHASGNTGELTLIFNLLRGRGYRMYWHFANPFNVRNLRANPINLFGGTVELNVFAAPVGREAPQGLTEIVSPRDEPPRPPVAVALSGAVVAEYLPDLPVRATRGAKARPSPPISPGDAGGGGRARPDVPHASVAIRDRPRWEACLPILRCPRSGTALRLDGQSLVSTDGHRYPVVDGTPVLVRNVQPSHVVPVSPNTAAQTVGVYTLVLDAGPGWKLRLGADDRSSQDPSVLCLDSRPLPNVDIVVEPEALPFADNSVVYFEATTAFEHVYDPFAAAREFRRVLAAGGMFFINTAFMQAYHGRPDHYLNMTPQGAETFLVDDFELVLSEIPASGGPAYHLENSIQRFINAHPPEERKTLRGLSVDGFVSALTDGLREQPLPEFIKRALAARVVVCGRKPEHYEARRDAVHRQIGEDAFRRLKRDYYAARMALIERHFEVQYYSEEVSARTDRMTPPLTAAAKFLDEARVADPLDPAAWTSACDQLRASEAALRARRDQWIPAFMAQLSGEPAAQPEPMPKRRRLEDAEAELAELRASHSWRLTAPLRWLAARIGRMHSGSGSA
jgi:FkbM family methyltransferase